MEIIAIESIVLDGALALVILYLAWQLLNTPNLFKAVVLFISFGLVLSLAWIRLNAVDVAMAEAAIGAGLTGALFMSAIAKMRPDNDKNQKADSVSEK